MESLSASALASSQSSSATAPKCPEAKEKHVVYIAGAQCAYRKNTILVPENLGAYHGVLGHTL